MARNGRSAYILHTHAHTYFSLVPGSRLGWTSGNVHVVPENGPSEVDRIYRVPQHGDARHGYEEADSHGSCLSLVIFLR